MSFWHARTKSRTESGTTLRSNVLRILCLDLAQRRPLGRWELQQPGPHLARASKIPDQVRPERTDVGWTDEEPHVPAIGFPEEGSHPIGALLWIGRGEVLLELADRGLRPPQEVGPRIVVEEGLGRRWEPTRWGERRSHSRILPGTTLARERSRNEIGSGGRSALNTQGFKTVPRPEVS